MRGLQQRLEGRVIVRATAHRPDLRWPLPEGLQKRLTGARVTGFRRRGKYILMRLAGGDSVLLHLGHVGPHGAHPGAAQPADTARASGAGDRRRLAARLRRSTPLWLGGPGAHTRKRTLTGCWPTSGPNHWTPPSPLPASRPRWPASARRSRPRCSTRRSSRVSAISMSARRCSARRLSPQRSAHTIPGIARQPAGARDQGHAARGDRRWWFHLARLRPAGGELGYFQHAWKVYGREGEACERCPGRPACPGIRRITQSARSTFYCPRTQR